MNNEFAFIGTGDEASEHFYETFSTEEEVIEAAKHYYADDYDEYFGFKVDDKQIDELCPIITILKVEPFDVEGAIKSSAENVKDVINDLYWEFESSIDDGDYRFKKEFEEEFVKAVLPLVEKYGYATGITERGMPLYDYNIETGERV